MTSPSELMRILYDPVGWADAAWLARYRVDARWPARLSNRLLMRRAPLATVAWNDCQCARVTWLIAHWSDLPELAYIAGARAARDLISSRNGLTSLRLNAAQFVALPVFLPCDAGGRSLHTHVKGRDETHDLVMASGLQCVLAAMHGIAPGWHDRIRLRLTPPASGGADAHASDDRPSVMPEISTQDQSAFHRLLKFAASFHHAQNH